MSIRDAWLRSQRFARSILKYSGEILVSVGGLTGWAFFTASIARLLPFSGGRSIWFASTGLLLLSLCGWKFLRKIVTDGLYAWTRQKRG